MRMISKYAPLLAIVATAAAATLATQPFAPSEQPDKAQLISESWKELVAGRVLRASMKLEEVPAKDRTGTEYALPAALASGQSGNWAEFRFWYEKVDRQDPAYLDNSASLEQLDALAPPSVQSVAELEQQVVVLEGLVKSLEIKLRQSSILHFRSGVTAFSSNQINLDEMLDRYHVSVTSTERETVLQEVVKQGVWGKCTLANGGTIAWQPEVGRRTEKNELIESMELIYTYSDQ